jgi:hypothetical protein
MCKKLIYFISFVLVQGLVLTRTADADLVGYWTFDEGSGTIAYDHSGQGNDGAIEGDPQWVAALGQTRLYWNGGQFNSYGTTDLRDNLWHHVAWVRDKTTNACYTYIDGRLEATHSAAGADITFVTAHSIGGDNRSDPPNFRGLLDDVQIYGQALSHAEIAWLAGRTKPFDKPF